MSTLSCMDDIEDRSVIGKLFSHYYADIQVNLALAAKASPTANTQAPDIVKQKEHMNTKHIHSPVVFVYNIYIKQAKSTNLFVPHSSNIKVLSPPYRSNATISGRRMAVISALRPSRASDICRVHAYVPQGCESLITTVWLD